MGSLPTVKVKVKANKAEYHFIKVKVKKDESGKSEKDYNMLILYYIYRLLWRSHCFVLSQVANM